MSTIKKYKIIMKSTSIIKARIDEQIKRQADIVLKEMGLTLSEVFSMVTARIAHEKIYLLITLIYQMPKLLKRLRKQNKAN